jgi:hypothetical protein
MSKVIDVTTKVKEYHNSDEYKSKLRESIKNMSKDISEAEIKLIIQQYHNSTDFARRIEKIHNDLTSGTTFWEKLSKDLLISATIKSQTEIVASTEVKTQIKKQLAEKISAALNKQLPEIKSRIISKIDEELFDMITEKSQPIITRLVNESLTHYINNILPSHVNSYLEMQFTNYLNNHTQLQMILSNHSAKLNHQLAIILGNMTDDPQYHQITTSHLQSLEYKFTDEMGKLHNMSSNQMATQEDLFNVHLETYTKTINLLTTEVKEKILLINRLCEENVQLKKDSTTLKAENIETKSELISLKWWSGIGIGLSLTIGLLEIFFGGPSHVQDIIIK